MYYSHMVLESGVLSSMMNKTAYNNMIKRRDEITEEFQQAFDTAKNYTELLQAYATYVGKLEAILDTLEVTQKRR